MLVRDLHLWVAGDDIRTGRVAVVKHPAACKQRRDTAAATRNDMMETSKWVVRGV